MVANKKKQCEICKIFTNLNRVDILLTLRDGSKTVSSIVSKTGLNQSVVSQHLAILKSKGIVENEKKGAWIYYTIKHSEILEAFDIMKKVSKKINGGNK